MCINIKKRRFIIQENVNGKWVTLAKISDPKKAADHLLDIKAVAPELKKGERYRTIREGDSGDY